MLCRVLKQRQGITSVLGVSKSNICWKTDSIFEALRWRIFLLVLSRRPEFAVV